MAATGQFAQSFEKFSEQIKGQQWYQQLQSTYEQLPANQQKWVKWGSLSTVAAIFFYFTWSLVSSSNQTKHDYFESQELLQLVNQAGDEIKRLKGQNAGFSQSGSPNWKSVFQGLGAGQSLPGDSVEVLKESPGPARGVLQETLVDVQIKAVTVRPLVQLLYQVEHGNPPMKIRSLHVESASPDNNLLNVKLSVSGFSVKNEKEKEKK